MVNEERVATVAELQSQGVLFVEDGNHGEYRPLADEFDSSGTPFIRPDDLKGGRVDFENADRINEQAIHRVRKGKGRAGDIVFTHRATVGRIARAGLDAPPFVANPGVTIWRSNAPDVLDPVFLYFFMQTSAFMNQVWAEAGNTDTFPYVSLTQQRGLSLVVPSIGKQRAIAHILGTLDDRIELNRRMNETLEAMARALFQSWFIDFDPARAKAEGRESGLPKHVADLFPDSFEDSGRGEIPKGWRVGSFLSIAQLQSGGTPKTDRPEYWDGPVLWASAKDVSQANESVIVETERTITQKGVENSATQVLPEFASVVVARGATTGRMVLLGEKMAMNQTCYALVSSMGAPFLLFCQLREEMNNLVHAAHGSVFDTITTRTFQASEAVIPAVEVAKAFDSRVASLFIRLRNSVLESRTLAALRDTLLPKLISGEMRVKDAENLVEKAAGIGNTQNGYGCTRNG